MAEIRIAPPPWGGGGELTAALKPWTSFFRSPQQQHLFQQFSDVNVSDDGAEEEVYQKAARDVLERGGHEEDSGQAALVSGVPGLQDFTQSPVSLLLQVRDVAGGMEAWDICDRVGEEG